MIDRHCQQPIAIDFMLTDNRTIAIQFELKMIQLYGPSLGIYALPSFNDPNTWNAIIFVRNGYFKDAKFRFDIHLNLFPSKQPKIIFKNYIFHALIDQATGQLDVGSTLQDLWNYGNDNMLYTLMKGIRKMFTNRDRLSNVFSYNRTAAEMYDENTHQFITKAMKSVGQSHQTALNYQIGSSIITTQIQPYQKQQIYSILSEVVSKPIETTEKIRLFISKLLE